MLVPSFCRIGKILSYVPCVVTHYLAPYTYPTYGTGVTIHQGL